MDENNVIITEQQESTQEGEKTFTQDEANRIVEKHLNRERSRFNGLLKEDDPPREAALADRERAVAVKELQADAREVLAAKGIPAETLELLNYTNKESCDKSIEAVKKLMDTIEGKRRKSLLKEMLRRERGLPHWMRPMQSRRLSGFTDIGAEKHGYRISNKV